MIYFILNISESFLWADASYSFLLSHTNGPGTAWAAKYTELLHQHCFYNDSASHQSASLSALGTDLPRNGYDDTSCSLLNGTRELGSFPCLWSGLSWAICPCNTCSWPRWLLQLWLTLLSLQLLCFLCTHLSQLWIITGVPSWTENSIRLLVYHHT